MRNIPLWDSLGKFGKCTHVCTKRVLSGVICVTYYFYSVERVETAQKAMFNGYHEHE